MADYDWFDRGPTEQQIRAKRLEEEGFRTVYRYDSGVLVSHYVCLRGCGCLVWDIDSHIKNVCRTYDS